MIEQVRAWIRDNPDWDKARVDELAGGRSHRAWKLSTPRHSAVLKLDTEPRNWPGNSRAAEARVQRSAAEAGLAAPVDWHSPQGILTGWLDGEMLDADASGDARVLGSLGRAVRELHALPTVGRHFDLATWAEHYRNLLSAAGRLDEKARTVCDELCQIELPGPRVLSHNDLVLANILRGERIYFLDWEYAMDNSWLFDLATLHVEAGLDVKGTAALIGAYTGDAVVPDEFSEAVTAYRLLVQLWEASTLPAIA